MSRPGAPPEAEVILDSNVNSSANPDNSKSTRLPGDDYKAPNSQICENEEGAAAQDSSPIPVNDERATKDFDISSITPNFKLKWSLCPKIENEPADGTLVNSSANPDNSKSTRLPGDGYKAPNSQICENEEVAAAQDSSPIPVNDDRATKDFDLSSIPPNFKFKWSLCPKIGHEPADGTLVNSSANPDNSKSTRLPGDGYKAPNSQICENEEVAAAQDSSPIPVNDDRATKDFDISSIPPNFKFKWSLCPKIGHEPADGTLVKSNMTLPECNKAKDAGEVRATSSSQREPDLTESENTRLSITHRPGTSTTEGTEKCDEESYNVTIKNTEDESEVSKKCDEESTSEETTGTVQLSSIENENGSELNNSNLSIADNILTNDIVDIDKVGSEEILPGTSSDELAATETPGGKFNENKDAASAEDNDENHSTSDVELDCPICYESYDDTVQKAFINTCMHKCCYTCIVEWIKSKPTCPLCRKIIVSILNNVNGEKYDELLVEHTPAEDSVGDHPVQRELYNPGYAEPNILNARLVPIPTTGAFVESLFPTAYQQILQPYRITQAQERDQLREPPHHQPNLHCVDCGRVYNTVNELASHMRAHERERVVDRQNEEVLHRQTLQCCECGRVCASGAGLASHMRAHERNWNKEMQIEEEFRRQERSCGECGRVCESARELSSHIRAHEKGREISSQREETLRRQAVRCGECGRVCESAAGLASHMRAHDRDKEIERQRQEEHRRQAARCGECGRVCESAAGLASHIRAHEREREIANQREEALRHQAARCGECGRVCEPAAGLASHIRAHEREREIANQREEALRRQAARCGECGRVCDSAAGLASHMRAHDKDREIARQRQEELRRQAVRCGECGRVCESAAGLASHMRAHDRDREIARQRQEELRRQAARCGECGRVCESAAGLASHMRAHDRDREIARQRQEELASQLRTREREREREMERQRQEESRRSFSCGECGRVCASGAGLASHMRSHERDRYSYGAPSYGMSSHQSYSSTPSYGSSSSSSYGRQSSSYECGMCGMVCGSGAGLASHMRAHMRR